MSLFTHFKKKRPFLWSHPGCLHRHLVYTVQRCLAGGSNYSHGNGLMLSQQKTLIWHDLLQCNAFCLKGWDCPKDRNEPIHWLKQNFMQTFQVMLSQDSYITMVPSENRREIWNEVLLSRCWVPIPDGLDWHHLKSTRNSHSTHACFKPLHDHPWKRHKLCTSGQAKLF